MECKLDENHLKQGYNRKYENVIKKKKRKQVQMKFKIKNQRK